MFFWFVVSLTGFTTVITLMSGNIVFPIMTSLFLYCMLNMREKFYGEEQ